VSCRPVSRYPGHLAFHSFTLSSIYSHSKQIKSIIPSVPFEKGDEQQIKSIIPSEPFEKEDEQQIKIIIPPAPFEKGGENKVKVKSKANQNQSQRHWIPQPKQNNK